MDITGASSPRRSGVRTGLRQTASAVRVTMDSTVNVHLTLDLARELWHDLGAVLQSDGPRTEGGGARGRPARTTTMPRSGDTLVALQNVLDTLGADQAQRGSVYRRPPRPRGGGLVGRLRGGQGRLRADVAVMTTVDWYVFSICVAFCAGAAVATLVVAICTGTGATTNEEKARNTRTTQGGNTHVRCISRGLRPQALFPELLSTDPESTLWAALPTGSRRPRRSTTCSTPWRATSPGPSSATRSGSTRCSGRPTSPTGVVPLAICQAVDLTTGEETEFATTGGVLTMFIRRAELIGAIPFDAKIVGKKTASGQTALNFERL